MKPRLNRLFAEDGKCFDVAFDHGFFNELSFLAGIEDMSGAVRKIAAANPDAIQLTVGQARHLQQIPGKRKPSLVMRTDAGNFYNKTLHHHLFSELIDRPVEQALALDAACVVVNLLLVPGRPELHHQSVRNVFALKRECDIYGMPLMVEPLVMQANEIAGGYMVDGDIEKIIPLVRQAVEFGADLIKADPCDNVGEYHRVIEAASGIPVLVRGGGRIADEKVVASTHELMKQGASGIVYGRNVIQHPHPERMTRALMAIVHESASVAEAMAILGGDA
ncbi:class I fructose-bisphosphate aldolase [Paenibacillus thalictri]|uniref:Aldolase n=1 Tax=Paenibacillus thalictri TaxID=2527873 RepID=A0A4Q9DM63_9BACL|nr:aldolase [Paenibacillus thalictri]TBL76357.1 aldolase [Paenibacillus thalictri]